METRTTQPDLTELPTGGVSHDRSLITAGIRFILMVLLLCLNLFALAGAFDWLME